MVDVDFVKSQSFRPFLLILATPIFYTSPVPHEGFLVEIQSKNSAFGLCENWCFRSKIIVDQSSTNT